MTEGTSYVRDLIRKELVLADQKGGDRPVAPFGYS
jgi:hypothetical protein